MPPAETLTQTGHWALSELAPPKRSCFPPSISTAWQAAEGLDLTSKVNLFGKRSTISENSKPIAEINWKNGQPKSGKVKVYSWCIVERANYTPLKSFESVIKLLGCIVCRKNRPYNCVLRARRFTFIFTGNHSVALHTKDTGPDKKALTATNKYKKYTKKYIFEKNTYKPLLHSTKPLNFAPDKPLKSNSSPSDTISQTARPTAAVPLCAILRLC